jgi:hypothetical protein
VISNAKLGYFSSKPSCLSLWRNMRSCSNISLCILILPIPNSAWRSNSMPSTITARAKKNSTTTESVTHS